MSVPNRVFAWPPSTPIFRVARLCLVALMACESPSAPGPARGTPLAPAPSATPDAPADVTGLNLPSARNGTPLLEGGVPIVSVVGARILRDGQVVGDAASITAAGHSQRVDGLWESLKAAREQWKSANPGKPFPGVALFAFEKTARAVVVKSVFQTAAYAAFPNAQFAVRQADGAVARLDVDAIVAAPGAKAPEPKDALLLTVRPSKCVLVWVKGGAVVSKTEVASAGDLPARLQKEWAQFGRHRDSSDRSFDQAVLYVNNDVEHASLIAAVDALMATTRDFGVGGARARVPAMNVSLAVAEEPATISE